MAPRSNWRFFSTRLRRSTSDPCLLVSRSPVQQIRELFGLQIAGECRHLESRLASSGWTGAKGLLKQQLYEAGISQAQAK